MDNDLNDASLRARAVKAARGLEPFDLLLSNGHLVDVVTGGTRMVDVGIVGGLITSVHAPDPSRQALEKLDADGRHMAPGLIDTHMHIESSMVTLARVAFLENWGAWRGACATTVSHDSHNLTVFGRDPEDMPIAANAVRLAGGGLCAVAQQKIVAQVDLPLAGLVSEARVEKVASGFATIRKVMDEIVDWQPPYLVLKALFGASLVCNAGPRLSDVGIVDVFERKLLGSPVL